MKNEDKKVLAGKLEAFNFDIKLNGVNWENDIHDALSIDRTDLDSEFEKQPVNYAYYAYLHEVAKDQVNRQKHMLEILMAQVDHEVRTEAQFIRVQDPKAKFTETMFANMVKSNERVQKAQLELLDMQKMAGVLGSIKEGIAQKKESLISMGANHRASTGNSLRVLEQAASNRVRGLVEEKKETKEDIIADLAKGK